jgi:hypothetical protein
VGVAGEQLLHPGLRLSGQFADRVDRLRELGAGRAALRQDGEHGGQATGAGVGWVPQDGDGVTE